ncbi:TPA: hypothetical protein OV885_001142 [Staphylococcus aureus]|nr:hypothetical protein [Staphylococcus aureus]EJN0120118.1 hypothetical protein [Staphylococcus aureus]KMQ99707.1 hypothetical protein NV77_07560 [Staphylococcus aureus]MBR8868691.1 hypothetical protein [Staphylococcus aureus]MBR8876211.1 hypothetical protein [Staphylococcus aureus]MBS3457982.1 hypothetical protein [Staphylococcus aureus]
MKNVSIYKTTQKLSFVSSLDFYLTKHLTLML